MSEKTKVYQGVRVKITVKELLQQRRARQAETIAASRIGSVPFSEVISSCAASYVKVDTGPLAPSFFQPAHYPEQSLYEDTPSYLDQHLLDSYLQPEPFAESLLSCLQPLPQDSTAADSLPHSASTCFNQSLCPESPSDSSELSSSFDYSYSPPHEMLSFVPLNYSSPTHMEARSCSFDTTVDCSLPPQYTPAVCYCVSCTGAECLETIKVGDFFTYPNAECTDYHPTSTITEDFLRREMNTWDICYS